MTMRRAALGTRYSARTIGIGLLALVACGPHRGANPTPSAAFPRTAPRSYVIQLGDQLSVRFYRQPELNEDIVVRPDGKISLQYVADVPAAGRAPAALAQEIARLYAGELNDPQVTVMVKQLGAERYYIGGEVEQQGMHELTGGLTLFQAIQQSGGFRKTANRKQVLLIRRDADGQPQARAIDLRVVQDGDRPEDDVALQPHDLVFVPRSKVANVNVFVEQYIRNNLPVQPGLGMGGF